MFKAAPIRILRDDHQSLKAVLSDTDHDHRSHGLFEAFFFLCIIIDAPIRIFFSSDINTFIQKGCIELIKSDSKYIYKGFRFFFFFYFVFIK